MSPERFSKIVGSIAEHVPVLPLREIVPEWRKPGEVRKKFTELRSYGATWRKSTVREAEEESDGWI